MAVLAAGLSAAAGTTARADCLDEIGTVYATDLDATTWTPYRSVRIHKNAEGETLYGFDITFETPERMITATHGRTAVLMVERETWTGPGPDGPWTKAPNQLPENPRATYERLHAERTANLSDAGCHGVVEVEGEQFLHYSYTTRTDPDASQGGTWFGGHEDAYLDPETRDLVRLVVSDIVAHYKPEPDGETFTEVYSYDPTIRVAAPE
jgi:hypothetical protein